MPFGESRFENPPMRSAEKSEKIEEEPITKEQKEPREELKIPEKEEPTEVGDNLKLEQIRGELKKLQEAEASEKALEETSEERKEMDRIENLEKHSEKLEGLLRLVDGYAFPENPLPVKIGKATEKEGEAAHRRKFYEVNRKIDKEDLRDSYNVEKLTEIAMHEVRHRVQWNSPKMEILNPENLKNFKDLKNFEKEYESLEKSGKEFYELLPEKLKKDKDYARREFDAEMIEKLTFVLREKGIPLSEISNKVLSQDAKTISKNIEFLLEQKSLTPFYKKPEGLKKELEEKEVSVEKYERFGAEVEEIIEMPPEVYLKYLRLKEAKPVEQKKLEREIKEATGAFLERGMMEVGDIKYTTEKGKTVSLRELLPKGWKFEKYMFGAPGYMDTRVEEKRVHYSHDGERLKEYYVPKGKPLPREGPHREVNPKNRQVSEWSEVPLFTLEGSLLHLLHEIGHAHFYAGMTPSERRNYLEAERRVWTKSRPERAEDSLGVRYIVEDERKSWAWALRTFRKLREEGIDFEPALPSNKTIIKDVEDRLSSYKETLTPEAYEKAHRYRMTRGEKGKEK